MATEQHHALGPTPLRSALKTEDEAATPPASGSLKAVQIADPPGEEVIDDLFEPSQQPKLFRASSTRRLSGKPASSSRSSVTEGSPAFRPSDEPNGLNHPHHHHSSSSSLKQDHQQYYSEKLLAQVSDWLDHERRKAAGRTKRTHHTHHTHRRKSNSPPEKKDNDTEEHGLRRQRSDSVDSQGSDDDISLDRLQRILEDSMSSMGLSAIPHFSPRPPKKTPRRRGSLRAASSDTDYIDGDPVVPSCDAVLDNSKTLIYSGTALENEDEEAAAARVEKEKEVWLIFKNEIVRIAHTLRLKGWRRVPLGSGDKIFVERLSGALTNAVYVVSPPDDISAIEGKTSPPKILLRIYGPQVEHLIDRDNELKVLQRLARKRIGPRLLGTFKNGRFEQYFNANPLTPAELREPDTMKQIAKRMRELHEGIELLSSERDGGPGVWRNWDQWLDTVGRIVTYLDQDFERGLPEGPRGASVVHSWKANGRICGVPWAQFKQMVIKFRTYLESHYKDRRALLERLVFAHSDAQYGNILRVRPDDEKSPLLQPANKHKQLIVIDFEYAAANTPGLDFANHFTEWCYNYHDPVYSYACTTTGYPTPDQQRHFIKAYVDHRPQFPAASSTPRLTPQDRQNSGGSSTPSLNPTQSSSSIVDFMLDARAPPGGWSAAERAREEESDDQVRELMEETRLWRTANSAMWVAWGVVQAKIPGLDESNQPVSEEVALKAEDDIAADEFDYLNYSQSRALFFWGDCVQLGLVKREDLPEPLRSNVKIVEY